MAHTTIIHIRRIHSCKTNLIENSGGEINNTEFTDKVKVSYVFKDSEAELFINKLTEVFSARLSATIIENTVFPFEI